MGVTKTENFTDSQNELAIFAKALGHPARVAIIEFLLKTDQCICGDIVNELPLKPSALLKIIESSKMILGDEDLEIEVEYQTDTIGKYGLELNGENFVLVSKNTDCLAQAVCGTPKIKQKMVELVTMSTSCCTPGGGCC
jgi:hypothetical protein